MDWCRLPFISSSSTTSWRCRCATLPTPGCSATKPIRLSPSTYAEDPPGCSAAVPRLAGVDRQLDTAQRVGEPFEGPPVHDDEVVEPGRGQPLDGSDGERRAAQRERRPEPALAVPGQRHARLEGQGHHRGTLPVRVQVHDHQAHRPPVTGQP